ncbi:Eukaryotic aspartyl protease [Stemphylium lycopersici]|nr:peptidase a1 protein [Stemphylium lycopersici]RAR04512.1 Eukaryotic aspartyl protease [Stemphylium lycopersici]
MVRYALTFSALASSVLGAVPTVNIPLNLVHGSNHKISTELVDPSTNRSIEVVVDQGSENFWVFGPDSIRNWGCRSLGCAGPCNETVQPFYDYPNSPTASKPMPFPSTYAYGGNSKLIWGHVAVNDSFQFASDAGLSSTVDTKAAISYYMQSRIGDDGTCTPGFAFDHGILGISPYYRTPRWNTTGPHVRHDLLEAGAISAPVQSLWFDEAPEGIEDTFTGHVVFGGIDHSKYTGELVKIPMVEAPFGGVTLGYYVNPPVVSINGTAFGNDDVLSSTCLVDSGTTMDSLPVNYSQRDQFAAAAGLTVDDTGVIGWNGTCESIPKDVTFDLEFTGVEGKKVTIKVPLRTYARTGVNSFSGLCSMSFSTGDCLFGAPFATAAFFAADDAAEMVAFAQGGVSKKGSQPDADSITLELA